ncbi:unnamed protein product [Cuscuta europaea]|uniref:TF-B3 domain-containing protein n=1 Tax=Cuscuta europaea TaxID=41803 RepID=A0A9P0YGX3_CUSEU|nr:unnamed protein product [Cuscuta europaea]
MEAKVPRFFEVLPPGFHARLRLPRIISRKLREKETQKVLLITVKGNSLVTIQKLQDGRLWFTNGWYAFVLKHGLTTGDFITFKHMGSSNFKVTVYTETCCEKDFIDEPEAEVKAQTLEKNASPLVESEAEEVPPPPPSPTQHHFHMNDGSNSREGLNWNHLLEASTDELPLRSAIVGKLSYKVFLPPAMAGGAEGMLTFSWRFLKVMFPGFETQLTLPPLVCEKLNGEKSSKATLVTAKGSWDVDIENGDQGNLCFGKGWDAFVMNHGSRVEDFAVFEYIGGIGFNVSLLDKSGIEKKMDSVNPGEEDDQKIDSTKPNPINEERFKLFAVKVERDEDIITSQLNSRLAPLLQILAEMDNEDFTSYDGEKRTASNH